MIDNFRPGIKIQEEDGSPVGRPRTFKIPNTALTDNGDGTFSLSITAIGDVNYLKLDQTTPQSVINGIPIFVDGVKIGNSTTKFVLAGDTLSLYVNGGLAQTWTIAVTTSKLLLENGDFILLESGDKLLLEA